MPDGNPCRFSCFVTELADGVISSENNVCPFMSVSVIKADVFNRPLKMIVTDSLAGLG